MFWTVEYADGTYVSQFDIEPPFKEHPYSEVNHKRAVRYWWLPIPPFMIIHGVRHNPLLGRHCVENRGAQGYLSRRVQARLEMGKRTGKPPVSVGCYIVGIEGEIEGTPLGRGDTRSVAWLTTGRARTTGTGRRICHTARSIPRAAWSRTGPARLLPGSGGLSL